MPQASNRPVFKPIPPAVNAADLGELTRTLAAAAPAADKSGELPWSSMTAVSDAGLLTATVDARFGGPSITPGAYVDAFAAMGEGDPSVALVALMTSMQHSAVASGVSWPREIYARVLQDSATHPVLINTARSEPALGASERGGQLATTARRTAQGWVIDGRKAFVTGSEHLAYHVVSVSLPDEGQRGRAFIRGDSPGITVEHTWDGIGMRASSTHEVIYDGVEISDDALLLSTGPGVGPPIVGAMFGLGLSAIYVGIARAARDVLVKFLNERVPTSLGAPLATVERLQDATGEVTAQLMIAEEVLQSLTARLEAGAKPDDSRIAAVKLISTRAAINTVQEALKIAGSYGLSGSGPLQRHLRDVLCARPNPPQEDVAIKRLGVASLAQPHWRSHRHSATEESV